MREKLEKLLKGKVSEETDIKQLVNDICDEHSKDIGSITKQLDAATEKVSTLEAENKNLKNDLKERDTQLETLKNSSDNIEDLKSQIATLQADNAAKDEEHAKEINALKLENAIEKALTGAKAKNNKAVKALLDLSKVELQEDGTIKGLTEQLDELVKGEDTKFLFNEETKPNIQGAIPGDSGNNAPNQNVDFSKMSYEEIAKYYEENPN